MNTINIDKDEKIRKPLARSRFFFEWEVRREEEKEV